MGRRTIEELKRIKKAIQAEFDRMRVENPSMKIRDIYKVLVARFNIRWELVRYYEREKGTQPREWPNYWMDRKIASGILPMTEKQFAEIYAEKSLHRFIEWECRRHLYYQNDREDAAQEAWIRIWINPIDLPLSYYEAEAQKGIDYICDRKTNIRRNEKRIFAALQLCPSLICLLQTETEFIPRKYEAALRVVGA